MSISKFSWEISLVLLKIGTCVRNIYFCSLLHTTLLVRAGKVSLTLNLCPAKRHYLKDCMVLFSAACLNTLDRKINTLRQFMQVFFFFFFFWRWGLGRGILRKAVAKGTGRHSQMNINYLTGDHNLCHVVLMKGYTAPPPPWCANYTPSAKITAFIFLSVTPFQAMP